MYHLFYCILEHFSDKTTHDLQNDIVDKLCLGVRSLDFKVAYNHVRFNDIRNSIIINNYNVYLFEMKWNET